MFFMKDADDPEELRAIVLELASGLVDVPNPQLS
jgi:hypothetical protein